MNGITLENFQEANSGKYLYVLPGRNGHPNPIICAYKKFLPDHNIIGIWPEEEFYPIPNGPNDQQEAIAGLTKTVDFLCKEVNWRLGASIVGFSAGAVVALELGLSLWRFSNLVLHSGACFEPEKTIYKINSVIHVPKIMTTFSKNDSVFGYKERYLPMRQALENNAFDFEELISEDGGHNVQFVEECSKFILRPDYC